MSFHLHIETRRLHLTETWTISRNASTYKDNVFVGIEKDGVTGWGEAAPNVRYGEDSVRTTEYILKVRDLLRSSDFFQFEQLHREISGCIRDQNCAIAALDMAILDWVGKARGIPVFSMWGLDPADAPPTSISIGIDIPERMQKKILEHPDASIFKIKLGKDRDREIVRAVREVTDAPICVDANEGWTDKQVALEHILWLKDKNVSFVEQPLPATQHDDMIWLKRHSPLPLYADEAVHTARDIVRIAGGYHGINIKLMKSGGVQEAVRMIHVARALNMRVMLGCMVESSLAISAGVHLSPLADYVDLDGNLLLAEDPWLGISMQRGRLYPSGRPGLGVEQRKISVT